VDEFSTKGRKTVYFIAYNPYRDYIIHDILHYVALIEQKPYPYLQIHPLGFLRLSLPENLAILTPWSCPYLKKWPF
jgi:hypothetical protein